MTTEEQEIEWMFANTPIKDRDWNYLKSWHTPSEGEVHCPFCGVCSGYVKTNGDGFYRCKGGCEKSFWLLEETDKGEEK